MASGLRTKAEALALAGCDFLVVVSAYRTKHRTPSGARIWL